MPRYLVSISANPAIPDLAPNGPPGAVRLHGRNWAWQVGAKSGLWFALPSWPWPSRGASSQMFNRRSDRAGVVNQDSFPEMRVSLDKPEVDRMILIKFLIFHAFEEHQLGNIIADIHNVTLFG